MNANDQTNVISAYGDMNLFCTCGPVDPADDADDGITGAAAPTPK
jgi:glycine dehydrogenase